MARKPPSHTAENQGAQQQEPFRCLRPPGQSIGECRSEQVGLVAVPEKALGGGGVGVSWYAAHLPMLSLHPEAKLGILGQICSAFTWFGHPYRS